MHPPVRPSPSRALPGRKGLSLLLAPGLADAAHRSQRAALLWWRWGCHQNPPPSLAGCLEALANGLKTEATCCVISGLKQNPFVFLW